MVAVFEQQALENRGLPERARGQPFRCSRSWSALASSRASNQWRRRPVPRRSRTYTTSECVRKVSAISTCLFTCTHMARSLFIRLVTHLAYLQYFDVCALFICNLCVLSSVLGTARSLHAFESSTTAAGGSDGESMLRLQQTDDCGSCNCSNNGLSLHLRNALRRPRLCDQDHGRRPCSLTVSFG